MLGSHALLDGHRSGAEAPGVPALLQPCCILPHLAMCLKIRELPAENVVSPPAVFVPVRALPARRHSERRALDAETPTGHRTRDERRRFRLARQIAGAFSD